MKQQRTFSVFYDELTKALPTRQFFAPNNFGFEP